MRIAFVFSNINAPLGLGPLGHGLGHVQRVHLAVGRHMETAEHIGSSTNGHSSPI